MISVSYSCNVMLGFWRHWPTLFCHMTYNQLALDRFRNRYIGRYIYHSGYLLWIIRNVTNIKNTLGSKVEGAFLFSFSYYTYMMVTKILFYENWGIQCTYTTHIKKIISLSYIIWKKKLSWIILKWTFKICVCVCRWRRNHRPIKYFVVYLIFIMDPYLYAKFHILTEKYMLSSYCCCFFHITKFIFLFSLLLFDLKYYFLENEWPQ